LQKLVSAAKNVCGLSISTGHRLPIADSWKPIWNSLAAILLIVVISFLLQLNKLVVICQFPISANRRKSVITTNHRTGNVEKLSAMNVIGLSTTHFNVRSSHFPGCGCEQNLPISILQFFLHQAAGSGYVKKGTYVNGCQTYSSWLRIEIFHHKQHVTFHALSMDKIPGKCLKGREIIKFSYRSGLSGWTVHTYTALRII
jgi:hypothetical protein